VLSMQGIAAVKTGVTPDKTKQPAKTGLTSLGGEGFKVFASSAGQGNTAPQNNFADHAVVKLAGGSLSLAPTTIFDPSYGKSYAAASMSAAEQDWENASIDTIYWVYKDAIGTITPIPASNNTSVQETKFDH
jgi:hypothetical protein